MAGARPIISLVSLLILAGGIVLQFLVILSGTHVGKPENQLYFLQASTDGIKSSVDVRNPSRWTFFSICGVANGISSNCGAIVPALAFDPASNFGTTQGVPAPFVGTHHYYYLSRFMFAFYLIALLFSVAAFFLGLLALCTRLGAYMSGLTVSMALFFQTLAAALMTAWTVQGRKAFISNNQSASLGVKAFAFTWAAMGCFLVSTVLFCVGGSVGNNSTNQKKSYFSRKRSTRSRGSFIDNESQGRVKEEYE